MNHRRSMLLAQASPLVGKASIAPRKVPRSSHHLDDCLSIKHYNYCPDKLTSVSDLGGAASDAGLVQSVPCTVLLYTADERRRRDASPWTVVQAVLAPIQFLIFLLSLVLVLRYLATGEGFALATASVVAKTVALYAIMITGSIWEREVFGRYLFALHSLYLVALATEALAPGSLMLLALSAYAAYLVNAAQFLLKLRAARCQQLMTPAQPLGLVS
jgi:3-vinyl bacteriochlorophyllide hydratase